MVANTHTRPTVLSQGTFLSVSADEFAEAAAIAGFDALNIWRHAPSFESASAVGMATRRAGLSVHAVCRGGYLVEPDQRAADDASLQALDDAAELGADHLVVVVGPVVHSARATLERAARVLEALLPEAEDRGVALALEPFHPMFAAEKSALVTLRAALSMVEALDSRWVGIAADSYHLWWDPDLAAQFAHADGRILAVHLSDWLVPTVNLPRGRGVPGEGVIDLAGFVAIARHAGFSGPLEVEVLTDRFDGQPAHSTARLLRSSIESILATGAAHTPALAG
ncbi:sugar phosphate isomerase/epimerase family protein [Micromonospora sp. NBC_00617]|uniref:sugar phosphate isomerase/epimerase family protein n=1 Tax=Micromonospora sp. NBC_00617 TaxID=2903587 RepID=UPI0030E59807